MTGSMQVYRNRTSLCEKSGLSPAWAYGACNFESATELAQLKCWGSASLNWTQGVGCLRVGLGRLFGIVRASRRPRYIPHCMWLWQIEGAKPIEEVIELLSILACIAALGSPMLLRSTGPRAAREVRLVSGKRRRHMPSQVHGPLATKFCLAEYRSASLAPKYRLLLDRGNLRDEGTATASLNSMLVQKRRDLERFGLQSNAFGDVAADAYHCNIISKISKVITRHALVSMRMNCNTNHRQQVPFPGFLQPKNIYPPRLD